MCARAVESPSHRIAAREQSCFATCYVCATSKHRDNTSDRRSMMDRRLLSLGTLIYHPSSRVRQPVPVGAAALTGRVGGRATTHWQAIPGYGNT